MPSVRLEMLRLGAQDVERFALLAATLDACASTRGCPLNDGGAPVMRAGKHALDRLGDVVWGFAPTVDAPGGSVAPIAPYSTDTQRLRAVLRRVEVQRAVLALGGARGQRPPLEALLEIDVLTRLLHSAALGPAQRCAHTHRHE